MILAGWRGSWTRKLFTFKFNSPLNPTILTPIFVLGLLSHSGLTPTFTHPRGHPNTGWRWWLASEVTSEKLIWLCKAALNSASFPASVWCWGRGWGKHLWGWHRITAGFLCMALSPQAQDFGQIWGRYQHFNQKPSIPLTSDIYPDFPLRSGTNTSISLRVWQYVMDFRWCCHRWQEKALLGGCTWTKFTISVVRTYLKE